MKKLLFRGQFLPLLLQCSTAVNGHSINSGLWGLGDYGSIGFNAKDRASGQWGVVTAAHVAAANASMSYGAFGSTIGVTSSSKWQLQDNGNLDAAFIPFSGSSWTPTSQVQSDIPINVSDLARSRNCVVGMPITKCGTTTGRTTGILASIHSDVNVAYSSGTMLIKDTYECACDVEGGDSGSPVFNSGSKNLFGIMISSNEGTSHAVKASHFLFNYNLDLYGDSFCLGDVDGDGQITTTDSRLVLCYAAGSITFTQAQIDAANVDYDYQVTTTDARIILQHAANY